MKKTAASTARVPPPHHELLTRFWNIAVPPLAAWVLLLGATVIIRAIWPGPWTLLALTGAGLLAIAVAHLHTDGRRGLSRWLHVVTAVAAAAWIPWIMLAGPVKIVLGVWAVGGFILIPGWWVHLILASGGGISEPELAREFAGAAEKAGFSAKLRNIIRNRHSVEAEIDFEPGTPVSDAIKHTEHFESGLQHPRGAMSVTEHDKRANKARVIFSDPRFLYDSRPWPGPSIPHGSIAQPVRPGLYQDTNPVRYGITGHHLQIMGMSGAGKTTGGAWNELAETVSRDDAAVIAVDITKGEQFLGPLRPMLHHVATTEAEAVDLMHGLNAALPARTSHLAARGLTKWEPGCGLMHLTIWIEELPDLLDLLAAEDKRNKGEQKSHDLFVKATRVLRTAGIRLVDSLQRNDYTQAPTFVRGQMAHLCFGVSNRKDAEFGLSPLQIERGCAPQQWGDRLPGMALLDAPTISQDRAAVPWRTWYWGPDTSQIANYAEEWPWQDRLLDPITAGALGLPEPGSTTRRTLHAVRDPAPVRAPAPAPKKVMPARGRRNDIESISALREQLWAWKAEGKDTWTARDLQPLCGQIGRTAPWVHNPLNYMITEGEIEIVSDSYPRSWRLLAQDETAHESEDA